MASFSLEMKELKDKVIEEYYFLVRQAEKYYDRDYKCALKIQTVFRMSFCYKKFLRLKNATITIQRYYRGFKARERFKQRHYIDNQRKLIKFFASQTTIIQRYFRGFYCRKYVHDYYARKAYIKFITVKNEDIRTQLSDYYVNTKAEDEKRREEQARTEFKQLAKNLHHLSSTKNIPGVYNPQYTLDGTKPTAFNQEIEAHLTQQFKENYKWRPPDRKTIDTFKKKQLAPIPAK